MADVIPNFHGDIVTPSDPTYTSAIARWAGNTIRRAKVVAFPKDQDDVALAIAYAKSHNLSLAIRGGGHNPAGAASVEDGLVIDLSRHLNGVRVDPENKRAYVGGGALWDTVDKETIKRGLATVAGTVSHVGGSSIRWTLSILTNYTRLVLEGPIIFSLTREIHADRLVLHLGSLSEAAMVISQANMDWRLITLLKYVASLPNLSHTFVSTSNF